jgi:RNA polymerase sigma factor (sigma-70 family)
MTAVADKPKRTRPKCSPAAQELAADNVRLAFYLARRSWDLDGRRADLSELEGDALQYLCYAATKFEEGHGPPFGTYAARLIWLRLGHRLRHRPREINFTDLDALCGTAGWSVAKGLEPLDPAPPPDEAAAVREEAALALDALPPRLRQVLVGVVVEGKTLDAVGRRLGLSRERVRQLRNEALAAARAAVETPGVIELSEPLTPTLS